MQPPTPFASYPHPAYRQPPPPEPPRRVRALEAVTFAFRGEGALLSLFIGVLYLMIPIVGPIALLGYQTDIFRRLVRRDPQPLPRLTFSPFSAYLTRGIVPFLVQLLATVPLGVLCAGVMFVNVANTIVAFAYHHGGNGPAAGAVAMAMLLPLIAVTVVSVLAAPIYQALQTRAALTEDVGKSFDLRALVDYARTTYVASAVSLLALGGLVVALYFAGAALCFVGIWPMAVVAQIAATHLRWQTYELYLSRGGEPIPLKPEPPLPHAWVAGGPART